MMSRTNKTRLFIYLAIFILVMLIGTFGFSLIEKLSLIDAAYFTMVTIATVGYGDISPATATGKGLAIFLIFAGVGTFVSLLANATEIFIERRDNQIRLQKLQMVIGLFFSEAGTELMRFFVAADCHREELEQVLNLDDNWNARSYQTALKKLDRHLYKVEVEKIDIDKLRAFIGEQSQLLVRLIESPYMLEHESFTDLLIAVMHLKEELQHRKGIEVLPESDNDHLCGDIRRAYSQLVFQWLLYVQHLQKNYPFLFSLTLRTNPFDRGASIVVR
ncbi:potassium channel family protein [Syntrophotalea acetylenivorans]|nr:potassium channel family protein [Syntrophotalea acetylenivorans]